MDEKEDYLGNELLPEKDEDELEESPWRKDPEVVQPEDIAKPDGEKVILSTDFSKETGRHDEVQKEDLFGTEVNDGQLPDLNAKFVKVQNDAIKVIDMKEFMDNIGKSSLMDRDKAVSIESMFGNFFNKTNIPEMYSIAPAKTGYDKAIKHMQKVISVEEQTVVDSANAYVTLAYDNITALAEKMNNEVVPDVLSLLRDTQSYTSKSVRQIFDSRDTLPMLDENDQEVDISILDTERERQFHLPYENDHVEPLNRALNAFNNYLKSKELVHFLTKRLDQGVTPEPYKEPSHLDLNESIDGLYLNYMSYLSTLDMYIIFSYVFSDEFVKSVDSLKYIYTTSSEVYKKISDGTEPFKLDNEALDFSRLNKFIVDNSELIRLTNNKVNYANKVLSDLPQFFSIIEDLVVHLKYIFK